LSIKGLVLRDLGWLSARALPKKHAIDGSAVRISRRRDRRYLAEGEISGATWQGLYQNVYGTPDRKFIESIQFKPVHADPGPLKQRSRKNWPGF